MSSFAIAYYFVVARRNELRVTDEVMNNGLRFSNRPMKRSISLNEIKSPVPDLFPLWFQNS